MLAVVLALTSVTHTYYAIIMGYGIFPGSLLCAAAGTYATGVAKARALLRYGRASTGKAPRWDRVVEPCPLWIRRVAKLVLVAMLLYAALVWLETWHSRDSFNVTKLAALFSVFAAALAWNSAVSLLAAANWLDGEVKQRHE
jgi:hypothetical protein